MNANLLLRPNRPQTGRLTGEMSKRRDPTAALDPSYFIPADDLRGRDLVGFLRTQSRQWRSLLETTL